MDTSCVEIDSTPLMSFVNLHCGALHRTYVEIREATMMSITNQNDSNIMSNSVWNGLNTCITDLYERVLPYIEALPLCSVWMLKLKSSWRCDVLTAPCETYDKISTAFLETETNWMEMTPIIDTIGYYMW